MRLICFYLFTPSLPLCHQPTPSPLWEMLEPPGDSLPILTPRNPKSGGHRANKTPLVLLSQD